MQYEEETLAPLLTKWLSELYQSVPRPKLVTLENRSRFVFSEKTIEQAIVLRQARIVSGVNALQILMLNGFVQEQATIQRTLDEFTEDVEFLSLGKINGITEKHNRFIEGFFAELPDLSKHRAQKMSGRNMPRRDKVRAYLAEQSKEVFNRSPAVNTSSHVHEFYSGYVHGYYPQVMDLLRRDGSGFDATGVEDMSLRRVHFQDSWNYWFRAVQSTVFAARALELETTRRESYQVFCDLEKQLGIH